MPLRASFDAALAGRADTLVSRFLDRAGRDPERVAYSVYPLGALNALGALRWGEWMMRARGAAGSLLAHHIAKGERVAIFATNRELWPIASMATSIAGLVTVALHTNTSPELLREQIRDCRPAVVIVDTLARLKVIRAVQVELQTPFAILCDDLEALRSSVAESLFEWDTWIKRGNSALEEYAPLSDELSQRVQTLQPEDIASISYRPGTTVGVMHTHASEVANAAALSTALKLDFVDRMVVAETFCNPFERAMGIGVPVYTGLTVALVESPVEARGAARQQRVTHVCASQTVYDAASRELTFASVDGTNLRTAVEDHFGDECRAFVMSAEIVRTDSERDLDRAGVRLTTVYGVPEQTLVAFNTADAWHDDSVGRLFPDVEARIGARDELQIKRSALSCAGYFEKRDEFAAALSADGEWIQTGKRAAWVDGDALRITGDTADTLEVAGGRFVASDDIEQALSSSPLVAYAVCDANRGESLVAVLSLDRARVEAWARQQGVVAPWEALVAHPVVYEELARHVEIVNTSRQRAEHVIAFTPTEAEFTHRSGELNSLGQLNREALLSRYEHVFAELHARAKQAAHAQSGGAA